MKHPLRIVVLGYLVRCPLGGMAWHHLQYVAGLARLGHQVWFVEDSGDDPWAACYDPSRGTTDADPSYGLEFARNAFELLGLPDCWAYFDAFESRWHGPRREDIEAVCAGADLLINLSGSNPLRPWTAGISRRIYLDTDPVFTQVRHLADDRRRRLAAAHNVFFTFGENITRPGHGIPDDGFPWQPTRQPVVLDLWPQGSGIGDGRFTTVMQWDNSIQDVPRQFEGRRYGRKAESFAAYADLPMRCDATFEIGLGGKDAPRGRLGNLGWILRDPLEVTRDPSTYREFIAASLAEFSVAKEGYVTARSGWFSERSAAYLASVRPVVVQDTGFTDWLDTDGGVLAFKDLDEACAAVEDVMARYEFHCHQARRVAACYFDSTTVLRSLLDRVMGAEPVTMGRNSTAK
jgi:hypothetical protein